MNSGTIILENKSFRLTVGEDAIVRSLIVRETNTE